MKKPPKFAGLIVFILGLALGGCQKESNPSLWKSVKDPTVASQLKSFVSEKQAQAQADNSNMYPGYASLLAVAQKGDRIAVRAWGGEIINQIQQFPSNARWRGTSLQVAKEIFGAFDAFGTDAKYSSIYGHEIIQSIPPGSIYFGGTDPGRFVVTALQKSQIKGDPFFTLTQNALADATYLDYLRSMYSHDIYLPAQDDLEACADSYYQDAQKRLNNHQLKPGEDVSKDPASGRIQVSGIVAVMQINAMLVKAIFDHNTNREFYVEQSYPFDWMNPCLEPHGLIFKLNREPLARLSDDAVQQDHDYWTNAISPMIGDWLNDHTPVSDVAAFGEKVFLQHDSSHFNGDPEFVQNTHSQQMFSRDRCSIAALYAWRAQNSTDESEKTRMNRAADFAYRQAWALCPYLADAVFSYTQFLTENNDPSNALLVAETAAKFADEPGVDGRQIEALVTRLKQPPTK